MENGKNYTGVEKNNIQNISLSKIVYLTLITLISNQFGEYKKYKKPLFGTTFTPKIKDETLCKSFEEGVLKYVDINSKIESLQCSWIKRLYDDKFSWMETNSTSFN